MKIFAVAPLSSKHIQYSIDKGQRIIILLFRVIIIKIFLFERLVLIVLVHPGSLWILECDLCLSILFYRCLFLVYFFFYFIIAADKA